MDNDKELLEMAAKAAGITRQWRDQSLSMYKSGLNDPVNWNPLTDDGDALRLAVKLFINITDAVYCNCELNLSDYDDPYAATRRAIVKAAAKRGKAMP